MLNGNLKTFHRSSWEFCKVTQKSIEKNAGRHDTLIWVPQHCHFMLRQAWHFMALPGDLLRSSPPTSFAGPYGVLRRWPGSMDTECHMTTASTEQAASLGSNDGWERPGIWGMCWESWGLLNSFDGFLLAAMTVWPWHTMTLFGFLSESAMLCCHDRLNVWEMHNHPYWLSWLFGLFWGPNYQTAKHSGFYSLPKDPVYWFLYFFHDGNSCSML